MQVMTRGTETEAGRTRKILGMLVSMLLGALAGGAGAWFFMTNLPAADLTGGEKLLIALGVLPLLPLLVAMHEVGHLLGGRLAGFRALLLLVGPLRAERHAGRIRVRLNRRVSLFGGLAVSAPTDTRDLRRRTLLVIAGGPMVSLAGGAAFLGLWWALGLGSLPPEAPLAQVYAAVALLVLGVGSLAVAALALMPGTSAGFYTDGARILHLLRPGPLVDRDMAVKALTGLSLSGQRPRDWDAGLVSQALAAPDASPFHVVALQHAYAHALDSGDLAGARRHLEGALARIGTIAELARPGLLLEGAWFVAVHEHDAARARVFLDGAGPGLLVDAHQRLLAEAAVRLAEGDAAGALARAEQARAELGRAVDAGSVALDAERIAAVSRAAAEHLRVPAAAG
ncbi:MAG TPA: M50 family metallopeptidase [Longimicrobiaceae bacterium]|nr:M50 family metallopeptidase [Longimicrobiaceae bacterium]